jgi:GAF domain-containing protein
MTAMVENAVADLQRANAELQRQVAQYRSERDEALDQQAATAEVLQVINSSPGRIIPVFDAMLEKAVRLCDATYGTMFTQDGDRFRAVALRNVPEKLAEFLEREPLPLGPETFIGRVMRDRSPLHIADVTTEEPYLRRAPIAVAGVESGGARTILTVPLWKGDTLLGIFQLVRQTVRPFSDRQITLVESFAGQAVIAMENARLLTETREALEQQTATAEVLQVINSSPGDLAPVFDAMLEKALALCGAAFGILLTYDGERFHDAALKGMSGSYAEYRRSNPPVFVGEGSSPIRLLRGANVVHHIDIRAEEAYQSGTPYARALADRGGARTLLAVPLRQDETLLGTLSIYRQEVRPFSERQIAVLQNFAAQAVIAMENARLIAETQEALDQQTATAEVLGVINSSPGDVAPVFDAMLDRAIRLCEAGFGSLWTYDGELFQSVAVRNVPSELAEFVRRPYPAGPATPLGRLARTRGIVAVEDLASDPAYQSGDETDQQWVAGPVQLGGARSYLAVPLVKDETLVGAFALSRREVRPFTDKQIALMQNFAAQAVIAMENARLITETREALDQQTATAEVLQVINSSPGDLAPVFDAMLEKATRLCEADFGILWNFDGEFATAGALHRVPAAYAEMIRTPFRPSPDSGPARMMRGEATFVVADLQEFAPYRAGDTLVRAIVDLAGARSVVISPLRKDTVTLGAITIYRQEVRPFSDKQIALLQNFAAQAVIAMENARLLTETREALAQQTATSEVLQVINSSPGDVIPVFDAMLGNAMQLCEAAFGSFVRFDGEYFRNVTHRGVPAALVERLREPLSPTPGGSFERLVHGETIVHIADIKDDDAYRSGLRGRVAMVDVGGARTAVWVALRKGNQLLGAFVIYRQEVRLFTDKQIALLQNFAAQAVIAMENARLITETREALEQQTATAEVLQVINSSPGDLAPVFDAILEKAHSLCGADMGSLQLYDGQNFRAVAARGIPEAFATILRLGIKAEPDDPLVGGEPFTHSLDNVRVDDPTSRAAAELAGTRSALFVPLRKDDVLLGRIVAARREVQPFTEKQIALLQNFAAQAVIAMENARLITETRQALEQQTATAEVLGVINSSPGDLGPVFEAMLEKAVRLCDGVNGILWNLDGKQARLTASRNMSSEIVEQLRRQGEAGTHPILQRVLGGEHLIQFDLAAHDAYRSGEVTAAAALNKAGVRTVIWVALIKEGRAVGAFVVSRDDVRPFTDKQIALLQNFAAQAVIAMENARLLGELRQRTEEVAELNRGLEARVAEQVEELGRVGRLKRFLAPQLAEMIVSQGDEKILESHRREIVVVFCDLRGYTAFTETAEPEEVLDFLREYHGALGPLVSQFEGTLDQFSGDGIMVFFNDPVPIPNPAERAVNMAAAMREAASALIAEWRERGRDLGFGVGIAQGYATLGQIGFSERSGYTAIGTVCNVAARLCAEAKDGQILLSQRINVALKASVSTEQVGALALKGLTQPVVAYNVPLVGSQPAFRVIEGGPPST